MTVCQVFADWTMPLAREFFAPKTILRGQLLAVAVVMVCQHYPLPPSNFIRKCPKNQGNMSTAMEMAVKNAIIYPERVEFEKLLEDKPGLFIQLFNKLYENVGLGENFTVIEGK